MQQQNRLVEQALRNVATYWRKHGVPEELRIAAQARGVIWSHSIVVKLDIDFPGMPYLFGKLITQDSRFVYFEIDKLADGFIVEEWKDVTMDENLNEQNKGIGVGPGALTLKVLDQLNSSADE